MLHTTRGIVVHSIKYSETSIIVKIYTELFGMQSYLFKGIRRPGSKIKSGLFQPMTLLDLEVYHREKHSLQAVREVRLAYPFKSIPFDILKSSVALFINEMVYKAVREEEPNPGLFTLLWKTCLQLDETSDSISSFHLYFAMRLCHPLGIFPQNNYSETCRVFNLREGIFQPVIPLHQQYLDPLNSRLMSELLKECRQTDDQDSESVRWRGSEIFTDHATRKNMVETILLYYQLHLPVFRGVQSHHILHDVLA